MVVRVGRFLARLACKLRKARRTVTEDSRSNDSCSNERMGRTGRAPAARGGRRVDKLMQTGQTIAGKYRLIRQLGEGGMATVWSATNVFTEREFAVKFMLPHLARTSEAASRFLLEAKVSARINHPNIIEVIDVGQAEDGSLFLVMELLSGAALDVAIRRQRPAMAVHELMSVMRDVADALSAAHRSGVIHRDLKPTNVFLHQDRDRRMVPKILDFGVSKILEEEQNTALTMAGTVLGSPHYMSPEQAMGATNLDGRTDVFAFGGMLFEALTAQRAYDGPNFNALIVAIATTQPKRIDDVAPQLPESLRSLVRDCLTTDRDARLGSFDAIASRISAMLPELERSGLTLPGVASVDPLVTMQLSTLPMSSAKPVDATLEGMQAFGTFVRTLPRRTLALAAVAVALLGVTAAATVVRRADSASKAARSSAPAPTLIEPRAAVVPSTTANATTAASAGVSSDVPVISVDSLPIAAKVRSAGRVSITASPGWCSVSVDGVARGVTPMNGFELRTGPHRIDCVSPVGQTRTATVVVTEASVTTHAFTLDE
jgi:eukaryotic-like serine/threonine-protein kinase